MFAYRWILLTLCLNLCVQPAQAQTPCPACCASMGGVQYCDSSVGRYVCKNGYYSDCYCTRHAVMDLQRVQGCCLWQGGVMIVNELGLVVCNNGGVSEICSLQTPVESAAAW